MHDLAQPKPTKPTTARYLYAFTSSCASLSPGTRGIEGGAIELIRHGEIAAVCGPASSAKLRPERRHLAAHQGVLSAALRAGPVLPVRFGVRLGSAGRVASLLEAQAEPIAQQLDLVAGRVEMGVRIALDVPNIFQHLVETEPALREARDRMVALGSPHAERVEVGRLFERVLAEHRREMHERVTGVLWHVAAQTAADPPKTESELLRLAALVDTARQDEFEAIVHELGAALDATHRLDYSGPWAPHSFVKLDLSPESLAEAD